jgi:hypothetical protein
LNLCKSNVNLTSVLFYPDAKNTANRASTIEEQARIKIRHLEKDLEEKSTQVSKTERQNNALQNEIAAGLKDKAEQTVSYLHFKHICICID